MTLVQYFDCTRARVHQITKGVLLVRGFEACTRVALISIFALKKAVIRSQRLIGWITFQSKHGNQYFVVGGRDKYLVKGEMINMTCAWDKENISVSERNGTHDLPNTERALYPLSYENSWRARSFNWVQSNHTETIIKYCVTNLINHITTE